MAEFEVDLTADLNSGDFDAGTQTPPGSVPASGEGTQHVNVEPKPAEAPTPEQEGPSLRDQLSRAFKPQEDEQGRVRNPDGTFAPKPTEAATPAADPAAQPAADPAWLTPDIKEQYSQLPKESQEFLGRMMEGVNQQAARYQEYGMLESQLIGPRREAWAAAGTNPAAAIQQLFNISDFASTKPGEFVLWFADSQKLDLDKLLDDRDALAQQHPEFAGLKQEVTELRNMLMPQTTQAASQGPDPQLVTLVSSFAEEKDGAGQPLHPHFSEVTNELMPLISAIRAQHPGLTPRDVLAKAYESACRANPDVYAKLQAAEKTKQAQQERDRTNQARNAASSVTGAPVSDVSSTPNNPHRSLRDEIAANFAAATIQ